MLPANRADATILVLYLRWLAERRLAEARDLDRYHRFVSRRLEARTERADRMLEIDATGDWAALAVAMRGAVMQAVARAAALSLHVAPMLPQLQIPPAPPPRPRRDADFALLEKVLDDLFSR